MTSANAPRGDHEQEVVELNPARDEPDERKNQKHTSEPSFRAARRYRTQKILRLDL
jgi:hypothetical protein